MNGAPGLAITLLLCVLGAVCEGFDVQTAGVAAAGIRDELHPAADALGLFFSAGGAGLPVGSLGGGWARWSGLWSRPCCLARGEVPSRC